MARIFQFAFSALLIWMTALASGPQMKLDKQVYALNDLIKISYDNIPVDAKHRIEIQRYVAGKNGRWNNDQVVYSEIVLASRGQMEFMASQKLTSGRYAAFVRINKSNSDPIIFDVADKNRQIKLKTLALNLWHEGVMVPDGFNGIVNEIIASGADVALVSEVRNYKDDFMARLSGALKTKGFQFYTYHSGSDSKKPVSDVGLLSRFPIKNYTYFDYFTKTLIDVNNVTVAFYSCHLDYLYYAPYLYRGYRYMVGKLQKNITDVATILNESNKSKRLASARVLLLDAQKERRNGNVIVVGGDFNEPSFLDYTQATKHMYEHNGVIIPWNTTKLMHDSGYRDAYRVKYPDPVKYPGITYPSDNGNKDVKKIIDVPVDVRDRIDYVFYYPDQRMSLQDAVILGPSRSVALYQRVEERTNDRFIQAKGEWPTDHKGVLVTFNIGPHRAIHG